MTEESSSLEQLPINPPVVAESAPEPAATIPAEVPAAEAPKPAEEADKHELPKGVQRRIDRAVRAKYEAEARTKVAEEELQRWRGESRQQAPENAEPTIDKFDNIEHYISAKAKWVANSEIRKAMEQTAHQTQAQQEHQYHAQVMQDWSVRLEQTTAELPDFEEVLSASTVPMSGAMERAILESEVGPKLAYWLAQNPKEAHEISQLPPTRAIARLGRIEERLTTAKPAAPRTTSAPPPVKPVGNTASVTKDPGKMSDAEYAKWRQSTRKR